MSKDSQYLAIIDLGSNSVRLKIDQINLDGSYQTKQYEKRYVRLSSDMGPEKILKPEPIKRTLKALTEFRQICDQYKHLKILAVRRQRFVKHRTRVISYNKFRKKLAL